MEQGILRKQEATPVLEKQKTEQIPQFSFNALEKDIETIPGPEEKEQVMGFLNELKRNCQRYIIIEEFYQKARHNLQEVTGDKEAREGALVGLESWLFALASKKNVIIDGLNILSRLFKDYGLNTSWCWGLADEENFKEWVVDRNKELEK